jgi:hypothetical protein
MALPLATVTLEIPAPDGPPFRWTTKPPTDDLPPDAVVLGQGMLHGGHAAVTIERCWPGVSYWSLKVVWQGWGVVVQETFSVSIAEGELARGLRMLFQRVRQFGGVPRADSAAAPPDATSW